MLWPGVGRYGRRHNRSRSLSCERELALESRQVALSGTAGIYHVVSKDEVNGSGYGALQASVDIP